MSGLLKYTAKMLATNVTMFTIVLKFIYHSQAFTTIPSSRRTCRSGSSRTRGGRLGVSKATTGSTGEMEPAESMRWQRQLSWHESA